MQTKSCLYRSPSFLLFAWLTVLKSNLEDNQAEREGGARGFKGRKITFLKIGKSRDAQVHVIWQTSGVTTARTSQFLNQANAPRILTPRQQKYLPWSRQVTVGLDIRTVAGWGLAAISAIHIHTYVWKRMGDSTMTRLNIPSIDHAGIQAQYSHGKRLQELEEYWAVARDWCLSHGTLCAKARSDCRG